MNKILKYIGLGLLPLVSGCQDLFDKELPTYTVVKNEIYDATSAENALRGIYSYLAPKSNQHDFDSRYIKDAGLRMGFYNTQRNTEKNLQQLNVLDNASDCKAHWVAASEIVNAANLVIDGVNNLGDGVLTSQKKKEVLGEAYFMRAWAQLYLMKYFAWFWDVNSEYGPLMRRETTTLKNIMQARSTVREGYEMILSDLNYAIENAPKFTTPFRASKGLAKAYKVEVLMMRGEGNDLQDAILLADQVIHDDQFAMEASYEAVFQNGYASKELMFSRWISEIVASDADGDGGSMKRTFGGGEWPSETYTETLKAEGNGNRYKVTLDSISYEAADSKKKVISWTKLWKENGDCPMYYMRLAQMYIYRAEALFRTGAPLAEVLEELNVLRRRASCPELALENYQSQSSESIADLIFREAVRELGMENGSEYYMAVRMPYRKGYPLLYIYNEYFNWEGLCYPIPQDELKYNPLIGQNPIVATEDAK